MQLRTRVRWGVPYLAALVLLLASSCGGGGASTSAVGNSPVQPDMVEANKLLDRFNHYRHLAKVSAVSLDSDLSKGAQLHANWLVANRIDLGQVGLSAHDETPDSIGYTLAGYTAGHSSVIYQGVGPVEAVDNWFRTFYHRLGMLDPNLSRLGFGMAGDFVVLDIVQGRTKGPLAEPSLVVYPSPGLVDIPTEYKREIPHPIVGDNSLGIPITAELFGPFGYLIYDVQAELSNLDTGEEIPYYLQTPGQPFLQEWDSNQLICLIPKDPLPANSHIQVRLSAILDGSQYSTEWIFRTN